MKKKVKKEEKKEGVAQIVVNWLACNVPTNFILIIMKLYLMNGIAG